MLVGSRDIVLSHLALQFEDAPPNFRLKSVVAAFFFGREALRTDVAPRGHRPCNHPRRIHEPIVVDFHGYSSEARRYVIDINPREFDSTHFRTLVPGLSIESLTLPIPKAENRNPASKIVDSAHIIGLLSDLLPEFFILRGVRILECFDKVGDYREE